jgi:hypothetical protein
MAYYEQPGRTTATDDTGKQVITITYVGNEEASVPTAISGTVKSKSVVKSEAGQIRTQYQIQQTGADSAGGGGGGGGYSYEVVASVRTVPIEAHPSFGEYFLSAADKKKIKDAVAIPDRSTPTFDDMTFPGKAVSLYEYLISGVESYYLPSLVIRKTYQSGSPTTGAKVGKIASPGITPTGMPTGANFLLINVSARGSSGGGYTITEEYEMSGENGWDTFLYST